MEERRGKRMVVLVVVVVVVVVVIVVGLRGDWYDFAALFYSGSSRGGGLCLPFPPPLHDEHEENTSKAKPKGFHHVFEKDERNGRYKMKAN